MSPAFHLPQGLFQDLGSSCMFDTQDMPGTQSMLSDRELVFS